MHGGEHNVSESFGSRSFGIFWQDAAETGWDSGLDGGNRKKDNRFAGKGVCVGCLHVLVWVSSRVSDFSQRHACQVKGGF